MKKSQLIQLVKEELRGWSPQIGQTKGLTPDTLNKILTKIAKGEEDEDEELAEEKPGLWANIRAKRARGEKPAHKNSKAHKDAVAAGKKINAMSEQAEWPQGTQSRYQEYSFRLIKVMPDRAKYSVTDMETGELKGTVVFNTVDQLHDYAADLVKPLGGRQSSHFGTNEDVRVSSRGTGSIEKELEKAMQQVGQQIASAAKNVKPSKDDEPEDVNEGATLLLSLIAGAPGLIEILGGAVNFIGKVFGKKDGTEVGNWLMKIGHKFENFYISSIGGWIKAAFPQKFEGQDPNDVSSSLHDYAHGIYLAILGALAIASGVEAYKAVKLGLRATEGSLGAIKLAEVSKLSKEIAKYGVKL